MRPRRSIGLLVAAALTAATPPASARHDDEHELVSDTAYTLPANEMQLGLWRWDVGLTGWLDVGTYTLFWAVPIFNAQMKARVWHSGRWAFAVRSGLYYVDLDFVPWSGHASDARIAIVPFEMWASMPIVENWGLTIGSISTVIRLDGAYDPSEFEGAAVVDNQQLALAVEWRTNRLVKLVATMRWLAAERARGDATFVRHLDDFTTLEVTGAASAQAKTVRNAGYVMLSGVLSWETFNLRAGLGMGNFNLPAINVMLPEKSWLLDFDLYWQF